MNSDTVLGHLANRFAGQQENLATEALTFILRRSPAASGAFREFFRPIGLDCPGTFYIGTQQAGLDKSIPDMKCRDERGQLRVIVENKFWAGLTENQPKTYIRELFHELPVGVAALLFVVLKARVRLVWDEMVRRCAVAKIPVGDALELPNMTAAPLGGEHYLAATSWSVLLDTLYTAANSAGETGTCNDIAQLQGLCRKMDEEEFLPLLGEELTNLGIAQRMINFSELALDIVNQAGSRGLCDRKGLRETNFRYGSGAYIRIGEYTPWVGFDVLAWRRRGVSPIWITFLPNAQIGEVREKLNQFRSAKPRRCFDHDTGSVMVPIFLPTGVEKQRIIDDALLQIRELAVELGVMEPQGIGLRPFLTGGSNSVADFQPKEPEESPIDEMVLEVGAEGGSITLLGNKDTVGQWRFWMRTDETTVTNLLDKEDIQDLGSPLRTSESVSSFPEAIALLNRYPWFRMTPIRIHPEFRFAILSEVQRRGTPEDVAFWNSHAFFD